MTGLVIGCIPLTHASPLLPDLVSTADENRNYMYGGTFDTSSEPGRVLYRFDTAITNVGDGPLQLFEVTNEDRDQDVFQDVFDTDGGFTRTLIASFEDTPVPPFGRLHLESLALYNLRAVAPGGGVGDVVASHAKTSHAVVDSVLVDGSLPAVPPVPQYVSAFQNPLGISVGYADLYVKAIPTQRIDVTGLPSGQYWLEVVVDPLGVVQETDDTNNTTRILVDLTIPVGAVTVPGDFNNSGLTDQGDLNLVLNNWGVDVNTAGIPNAWVNDRPSGLIDQAELNRVLTFWGSTVAAPVFSDAVPEPAALIALLGLGFLSRSRFAQSR